jgi:hypothetical protein
LPWAILIIEKLAYSSKSVLQQNWNITAERLFNEGQQGHQRRPDPLPQVMRDFFRGRVKRLP